MSNSNSPLLIENNNIIDLDSSLPPPYSEMEYIEKKPVKWTPNHIQGYIIIFFVIIFVGFYIYIKKR